MGESRDESARKPELEAIAAGFEAHRAHLTGVAYRMLGSRSEADDAVQEAWLRLACSHAERIENLGGWLTTVVARVALDMLRPRRLRREEPLGSDVPDPIVTRAEGSNPEQEAVLADSVGLALLVVLEQLEPAERLAFVLHDTFAVPFGEIATIVERSPDAARQLASRARRRVRGAAPAPDADLGRQREIVNAYIAAAREGDFDGLLAVLDPDIALRVDGGPGRPSLTKQLRGAEQVAGEALAFRQLAWSGRPAVVNGAAGIVAVVDGEPFSIVSFVVRDGLIAEIDILADPERLAALDLGFPDESR